MITFDWEKEGPSPRALEAFAAVQSETEFPHSYMFGWALNAVRQMLGKPPGGNGAIVTAGKGNEPYPAVGSAEQALELAMGGDGK